MNLKPLRIKSGLSQEYLGRQLGVSRNTVKNWEDGVTEPTLSMCKKIARIFGVTVDELTEV